MLIVLAGLVHQQVQDLFVIVVLFHQSLKVPLSTDTDIIVSSKTIKAINSQYYALPDARGYFIRINDKTPGDNNSISYTDRNGNGSILSINNIYKSFQIEDFILNLI